MRIRPSVGGCAALHVDPHRRVFGIDGVHDSKLQAADLKFAFFSILVLLLFDTAAIADGVAEDAGLSARIDRIESVHLSEPWGSSQRMIDELRPALVDASLDQRVRVDLMEARNMMLAGRMQPAVERIDGILALPINLTNRIRALELSVNGRLILHQHARAFEDLNAALELSSRVERPRHSANVLALAARMHNGAGEPAMALEYAAESLELARKADDARVVCGAWWALVRVQESTGLIDIALNGADDLWTVCQQSGDPVLIAASLALIGRLHARLDDHDESIGWLRRAIAMYDSAEYEFGAQEVRVDLGMVLVAAGQVDAGLEMLLESAKSADMLSDRKKAELHAAIAEAMAGRNDYARALEHLELARQIGDRVTESRRMQRLAYLQAEFENQRRNQEMELLRQEHELLAMRQDTEEARRSARSLGVTMLAVIGVLLIGLLLRFRADRRRYRRLSEVDGLTGLCNHRRFHQAVENALGEHRERGKACSLIAADVDLFKQINDRYGHQAGDEVLRRLGALLLEQFPPPCIVGRVGGEEFAVFLPDHNRLQANQRIREFRERVKPIEFNGNTIEVTLSFGLVESRKESRLERLRTRADDALYRAKRAGRNQVVDAADLAN